MASIKFGNALLCEYVAQGANGKPTLVNVYSGDIVVAKMPATLGMGIFVELPHGQDISNATMELNLDKRLVARVELSIPNSQEGKDGVVALPQLPLSIEKDCELVVTITADGYSKTTLMKKRIFTGPMPGFTSPSA